MNKATWGFLIIGTVAYWGGVGALVYSNHTKQKEIENLNAQMVFVVKKYNKLNHAHNKLKKEEEKQCLIK